MTVPAYEGKYFKIEGKKLDLFGITWGYVTQEHIWCIYHLSSSLSGFAQEWDPQPVSPEICTMIQADAKAGNEQKIAYVSVNPLVALQLWLEGVITQSHFENCVEVGETTDEAKSVYIELYDVVLDGKSRTIRVYAFPDYEFGTFDADGFSV